MSYKKLGKYIKLIDNRNKDLSDAPLLGVSVQKRFITSIANTIGSDMSKYKLIEKNNFVYIPDTSRRGDKIGIALLKDFDKAMISQAYTSFKIIDENELSPDYLMMWFARPEFDRYARYHSIGSVREVFDWADMCEVELPIPSIEEQSQIVAQYQSITNKIKVNEQICEKLEATAQALYKHWFVDFEFPVGHCEESGTNDKAFPALVAEERSLYATKQKGYKSSGGKMVWNEELGKEIPEGWVVGDFATCLNFKTGKLDSNAAVADGEYPFFTCSEETYKVNSFSFDQEAILLGGNNATGKFPLKYFQGRFDAYQRTYIIDTKHERISNKQIYYRIKGLLQEMKESSVGTTTKFLTMQIFNPINIIIPNKLTADTFEKRVQNLFNLMTIKNKETEKLTQVQNLLLSRLAVGEEVGT